MTTPATSGAPLFDDGELEQAFGSDLGEGPAAPSASASPSSAAEPQATVVAKSEGAPTLAEFREGFSLGLYRDPVIVGVFSGAVLGILGVYVVLRRAVFVTAAITQAAGLGVALAFLFEIHAGVHTPPVGGAILLSLLATAVLSWRTDRLRLPRETLVGLTYLAASAAAVLVGDRITQDAHDITAILFGTAVLVRSEDLRLVLGVGSVVLGLTFFFHRAFLFAGFDPEGARVHRLPVRLLELLLWVLVALTASVTTRAIGALPVFAFAVLPAMAALALVERVRVALVVAAVVGAASGGLGYLFAFFFEFPVGASQALTATVILLGCLLAARLRRGPPLDPALERN
ncbi:MAG: metal ABC transporter permease [Polyangiaceae bacterium]